MTSYNTTGMSDRFVVLKDAVIFPPDVQGTCGVLDAAGRFVAFSQDHVRPRRAWLPPDPARLDEPLGHLPGRHMFAGPMHPHFGHFLLESTPRLWVLGADPVPITSVLFIPIRTGTIWRARKIYRPFLEIFCGDRPIENIVGPTRVETLVVPDPGFGHEARMAGSAQYRAFMRGRVAAEVKPEGPERLYISRTGLQDSRGRILGEAIVESVLAANGYEIFHPQRHSARAQLARYAAARQIVALDGSALHMAAYAMRPDCQVGMIARRRSAILPRLADQMTRFSGARVKTFDCLVACWVKAGSTRIDYSSIGEVDLARLFAALQADGFIETVPDLSGPSADLPETMDRLALPVAAS
jgi:capsular polysaccharide biosynthesis protein